MIDDKEVTLNQYEGYADGCGLELRVFHRGADDVIWCIVTHKATGESVTVPRSDLHWVISGAQLGYLSGCERVQRLYDIATEDQK